MWLDWRLLVYWMLIRSVTRIWAVSMQSWMLECESASKGQIFQNTQGESSRHKAKSWVCHGIVHALLCQLTAVLPPKYRVWTLHWWGMCKLSCYTFSESLPTFHSYVLSISTFTQFYTKQLHEINTLCMSISSNYVFCLPLPWLDHIVLASSLAECSTFFRDWLKRRPLWYFMMLRIFLWGNT